MSYNEGDHVLVMCGGEGRVERIIPAVGMIVRFPRGKGSQFVQFKRVRAGTRVQGQVVEPPYEWYVAPSWLTCASCHVGFHGLISFEVWRFMLGHLA